MTKTYDSALQARLEAYLSSAGISQNKASTMIGISQTALSQYRHNQYGGNVPDVEQKLAEFLRTRAAVEHAEEKSAPYKPNGDYVPTSISENVYKAIQYCQLERGMMVLHGDAGIGKTKGAMRFVAENPSNAIYLSATPISGTLGNTLKLLARALRVPETRNKLDLMLSIRARLHGTDKIIIIDEAQHLKLNTLEELRNLSDPDDATGDKGTGICLIGNTEVYSRMLGKQEAQFAQQFSRVKMCRRYSTTKVTLADMMELFPTLADGNHKKELEFLHGISQSKWGIRGATNIYNNAVNNEDITADGLRKMALSMGVGVL